MASHAPAQYRMFHFKKCALYNLLTVLLLEVKECYAGIVFSCNKPGIDLDVGPNLFADFELETSRGEGAVTDVRRSFHQRCLHPIELRRCSEQ
jgi:hypothetical protein